MPEFKDECVRMCEHLRYPGISNNFGSRYAPQEAKASYMHT